jgi:hypothetical protein
MNIQEFNMQEESNDNLSRSSQTSQISNQFDKDEDNPVIDNKMEKTSDLDDLDDLGDLDDKLKSKELPNTKNINREIHMFKHPRKKGKLFDTVISGIVFGTKEENKTFMSSIKKRFGIGGCQKKMEDIDKNYPVFVFTGDLRTKITKILVEEYKYDSKLIKNHG